VIVGSTGAERIHQDGVRKMTFDMKLLCRDGGGILAKRFSYNDEPTQQLCRDGIFMIMDGTAHVRISGGACVYSMFLMTDRSGGMDAQLIKAEADYDIESDHYSSHLEHKTLEQFHIEVQEMWLQWMPKGVRSIVRTFINEARTQSGVL
jgi:hypothetical protein